MVIVDLYKGYKNVYNSDYNIDELIQTWYKFMNKDKEVRDKCISDYEDAGYKWKEVATDYVFLHSHNIIDKMNKVYNSLLNICNNIEGELNKFYDFSEMDVYIVIYHGLGNGAGWATTYKDKHAILLGVEKIAELGWDDEESLKNLVAHEFAHVVQSHLRNEELLDIKDQYKHDVFKLYVEGYATYFESIINSNGRTKTNWFKKCEKVENELKVEYLARLNDEKIDCHEFYGDWFKVFDLSDTGYYMGYKLIQRIKDKYDFNNLSTLSYYEVEREVLDYLNS